MQGLRRICDEHGIVLVVDEVQTGFCRTGTDVRDRALRHRAGPDGGGQVDRRRPAALRRARPGGDHGRAGRQRRRRHVRRQPRRDRGRARRPRRDRGGAASTSAPQAIGETIRARMESWRERFDAVARGARARRDARDQRSSADGKPDADLATAVAEAAARARAPAPQGGHPLELHPRARAARRSRTPSSPRRSTSGRRRSQKRCG